MNTTPTSADDEQPTPSERPGEGVPRAEHIRRIRRGVMDGTYDADGVIDDVASRIVDSGDL